MNHETRKYISSRIDIGGASKLTNLYRSNDNVDDDSRSACIDRIFSYVMCRTHTHTQKQPTHVYVYNLILYHLYWESRHHLPTIVRVRLSIYSTNAH